MEHLRNIKTFSSNKFIIKPKLSNLQHLKSQSSEQQQNALSTSDQQIQLFLWQFISKSTRLKQLIQQKLIVNEQQFYQKCLFRSTCFKTIIKTILDKMLNERRLGKNLKGMNKSNFKYIQNLIWSSLLRQTQLYRNEKQFVRGKEELQGLLAQRKGYILRQLQRLKVNKQICGSKQ